ncbi:MAG: hypothetical protein ACRD9Y_00585 [Blastocatellia bacterium]
MREQVRKRWASCCAVTVFIMVMAVFALAQDAREALGPKDKPAKANEPHPLAGLMASSIHRSGQSFAASIRAFTSLTMG